jgi:hypothetical protein
VNSQRALRRPIVNGRLWKRSRAVANVVPTFAPMPRAVIQAVGGDVFAGTLYFGQYLDLPSHTSVIEKAPRVLSVTPTALDAALGESFEWYRAQPRRNVNYTFEDRLLKYERVAPPSGSSRRTPATHW